MSAPDAADAPEVPDALDRSSIMTDQSVRHDGSAELPDRDNDGDPDYHDPFPGDRNRNSTFPDGMSGRSGGTGGSSSGSSGGGGWGGGCRSRWC
ncbi:hypothetical protein AB0I02_15800 [Streptomyces phaeochromogenes]